MPTLTIRLPSQVLELAVDHKMLIPQLVAKEGLAGYEGDTIACVLACVESRAGAFFDIGANVGVFALLVAGYLGRQTHAFEPTPALADVIERATALLPVATHRLALSDKAGSFDFFLSKCSDASNSLNRRFRPGSSPITVTTQTLDGMTIATPGVMKIDVETAEPQVLAGARKLIDQARPAMVIEILRPSIAAQINAFFAGKGYTAYHIGPGRWTPVQEVPHDFEAQERNWLFSPSPLESSFWTRLELWRARIRQAEVTLT